MRVLVVMCLHCRHGRPHLQAAFSGECLRDASAGSGLRLAYKCLPGQEVGSGVPSGAEPKEGPVKITGIETFVVDAGWRPWQFVAVRTDSGLTGYGECSDGHNPYGVVATVKDFEAVLGGPDPRPGGVRHLGMYRQSRPSTGGIAAKARRGTRPAPWDITGQAPGGP